jgi:hypothetical protein
MIVCSSPSPTSSPYNPANGRPNCPEPNINQVSNASNSDPAQLTAEGFDFGCLLEWRQYDVYIAKQSNQTPTSSPSIKPVFIIRRTPTPIPSPNPTPTVVPTAPIPPVTQTQPILLDNFLTQAQNLVNTFKGHFIYWLSKVGKGVKIK